MKFLKKIKKFGFVFAVILVLVGSLIGYKIVQAATGGGTATIGVDDGAQSAGVTVVQSTSHTFTTILTIPTGGMTNAATSPTFTIPTDFTAPTHNAVATYNDVMTDGQWSVVAGGCTVSSDPASSTTVANGQVITVDITADCAVNNTITLTYQGKSATVGATTLTVSTTNAGATDPVQALTAGSPTITVTETYIPPPTTGILHVINILNNLHGGTLSNTDFSFLVNDDPSVAFENDGQNDLIVEAGTYNIVETAVDNYDVSYSNCSNLVIESDDSATCTITNNDIPEEVIPTQSESHSSSGSTPVYGCKDSVATNYNYFSSSRPELCTYASVAKVVTPTVIVPKLPKTGFPPQTWYESLINSFLNLFK